MSGLFSSIKNVPLTLDFLLGIFIMGTTGGAVGFYLNSPLGMVVGSLVGALLGGMIALFHARLFFISVLSGTVLAGALALFVSGPEMLVIGAGSGGAIGGFIGVNLEMFRRR